MRDSVERFSGRVGEYARYRMGYPAWVAEVLRQRCGLRAEWQVADLGAGTGMLTELLLREGCRVLAVEPNAEMRTACAALGEAYGDRLEVRDAAAEETGLEDASVAMVTAGRAFHWFDRERALAEFGRILRPGGWLALVTNRRVQAGSAQAEEYERILMESGRDYAEVRGAYRNFAGLRPWGGEGFTERRLGEQALTEEEFSGQTQSLSVAPRAGEAGYAGMQRALRAYFARWSEAGLLRMETICEVVGWQSPKAASERESDLA